MKQLYRWKPGHCDECGLPATWPADDAWLCQGCADDYLREVKQVKSCEDCGGVGCSVCEGMGIVWPRKNRLHTVREIRHFNIAMDIIHSTTPSDHPPAR